MKPQRPVIMFAVETKKSSTVTIFLLLSPNGPGDFIDIPFWKVQEFTWERLWFCYRALLRKAEIREEKRRNGNFVY